MSCLLAGAHLVAYGLRRRRRQCLVKPVRMPTWGVKTTATQPATSNQAMASCPRAASRPATEGSDIRHAPCENVGMMGLPGSSGPAPGWHGPAQADSCDNGL